MASFNRLKQVKSNHLLRHVFDAINAAESNREKETTAACKIQSMARMTHIRADYLLTKVAAVKIQKIFRGYCGRLVALDRRVERERERQHLFFKHFAILIQKTFRGFFSRKWRSNFYEMKGYINEVVSRSERVRAIGEQYRQELAQEEERRRQVEQHTKFANVTKSLHHLVSTATIPGVFRNHATGAAQSTIFGGTVEDALRAHTAPRRKPRDTQSMKKQFVRSTVQSSSSFDIVSESSKMDTKLEKMTRISTRDFAAKKADTYKRFIPGHNLGEYQKPVTLRDTDKRKNIAAEPFRRSVQAAPMFDTQGLPPIASSIRVS